MDREGALVEPIFDFLRAEAVQRHCASGTLADEAYALAAWWDYVQDLAPNSAIDLNSVVHWTGIELERLRHGDRRARSVRRISRCLNVVTRFHEHLLQDWSYSPGEQHWRAAAYVARLDHALADRRRSAVTFGYSAKAKGGGRPTPSEAEVDQVLDALGDGEKVHLSARNWLIARWMRDVGLRRAGVASLSLESLRLALISEGVLRRDEFFTRRGTTHQTRNEVRAALERFRNTGRTFVSGEITEKGPKTRGIKIPFLLLHQTLDFIWSERASKAGNSNLMHGALWLSEKTGRGLEAGSIGDIVKSGFSQAGVAGSGHRLRACFAEEVVFRLYALAKVAAGIAFDENQVLIDAAEELGHSDWRTLRSYLNRAARNYAAQARGSTFHGARAPAT